MYSYPRITVSWIAVLWLGISRTLAVEYLEQPDVEWTRRLGSTSGPGNAVALSPDESILYVTASDGRLSAFSLPNNGRFVDDFIPPQNDKDWEVTCSSGVAFVPGGANSSAYLVYSVIDIPPEGSPSTVRQESRIIAMEHNPESDDFLKKPRWISTSFTGVTSGTPIVSTDGAHVYFTRTSRLTPTEPPTFSPTERPSVSPTVAPSNAPSVTSSETPSMAPSTVNSTTGAARNLQSTKVTGYFTILSDSRNGSTVFDSPSSNVAFIENHHYGPLAIARNVTVGMYSGAQVNNTNDILIWHSLEDPLPDTGGELQLFQFPKEFDGVSYGGLDTVQLLSVQWTTSTAPTIRLDGSELFVPTSEPVIRGWVENRMFDLRPNFQFPVQGSDGPTVPGVFSVDGSMLFVGSSTNEFHALDLEAENEKWTAKNLDTPVQTKAKVSPDGLYVYFASGKKLIARDVSDGTELWTHNDETTAEDTLAVEFALSGDGRFLYYTGGSGKFLNALRLAEDAVPTSPGPTTAMPNTAAPTVSDPPSVVPTTDPTVAPTASPTASPVERSDRPTRMPFSNGGGDDGDDPNVALIAGASVAGVVVLAAVGYALWSMGFLGGGSSGREPYSYDGGSSDVAPVASRAAATTSRDSSSGQAAGGTAGPRRSHPPTGASGAGSRAGTAPSAGSSGVGGPRRPYPPGAHPAATQPQPPPPTAQQPGRYAQPPPWSTR